MTLEMNRRQVGRDAGRAHVRVFTGVRQRGVSLIEVLVTLLVLAIGLLGLSALQGLSLQAGQVAYLRTQATNVGYEVTDFARANRSIASPGMLEGFANQIASQTLPEGSATVQFNRNTGDLQVTVRWLDDRASGSTAGLAEFVLQTRI